MQELSVEMLVDKARQLGAEGQDWHFHILTPECQLNDGIGYSLILEGEKESYVCYSDKPYMGVGERLVKILHGDDVVVKENSKLAEPSENVAKLLKRAKELTDRSIFWHHHMLFPSCKFNIERGKWVILFEDMERGEIIRSVSDDEPKGDLQHIEGLFYAQRKDNETKD